MKTFTRTVKQWVELFESIHLAYPEEFHSFQDQEYYAEQVFNMMEDIDQNFEAAQQIAKQMAEIDKENKRWELFMASF